jgi:hypothetical protein
MLQAHSVKTLETVSVGDTVMTFRKELGTLIAVDSATVGGRAGKVGVHRDGAGNHVDYWYASVVGLYVVDTESLAFCEASNGHEWHPVSGGREGCRSCGTRRDLA